MTHGARSALRLIPASPVPGGLLLAPHDSDRGACGGSGVVVKRH